MIVFASLCLVIAVDLRKKNPDNALTTYILWFISAIFAFCIFRTLGHLGKYIFFFSGNAEIWRVISPFSGSLNTVTFVVIFAVTLFYRDILTIMNRMTHDQEKIKVATRELFKLGKDMDALATSRTKAEIALKLAHEIRNPVMVIGGFVKKLICPKNRDKQDELAKIIFKQLKQLEAIVQEFEKLDTESENVLKVVELNDLVMEVIDLIRDEAADKKVKLNFKPCCKDMPILGEPQLLKLAISYLIHNSLEVCDSRNQIDISITHEEKGVYVTIKDDGPGIPEAIKEHIFKPLHETADGPTGLGLPYVKQIMDEHRGEVMIKSESGQGTVVILQFPTHLGELKNGN